MDSSGCVGSSQRLRMDIPAAICTGAIAWTLFSIVSRLRSVAVAVSACSDRNSVVSCDECFFNIDISHTQHVGKDIVYATGACRGSHVFFSMSLDMLS